MIYLDHAATCAMRPAALSAEVSALKNIYGNPSPSYPIAQQAKARLDQARTDLAETIGADWKEIFFTSGGTEGDNWALIGAAEAFLQRQSDPQCRLRMTEDQTRLIPYGHIITNQIEHHAVLHTCDYLESRGFSVSYLPVDKEGFVDPENLKAELGKHPDTFLVSIMMANNEVGTIEPVRELVGVVREFEKCLSQGTDESILTQGLWEQKENTTKGSFSEHQKGSDNQVKSVAAKGSTSGKRRILFHTDAVQAYGKIPIDVKDLDVDLLSVSAHKLGGPKGIGFLYIRKGTEIGSLMHGGGQESGRRAGTENVPAAIGFAAAAKDAALHREEEQARETGLQQYFYQKLKENFTELHAIDCTGFQYSDSDFAGKVKLKKGPESTSFWWNGPGPGPRRMANNVSISFPGRDQRMMLMNLDLAGICASGGSACTTGAVDPSHVLMAMTGDREIASGTLRFTLGPENTEEEIDETIRVLKDILCNPAKMR